MADAVRFLTVEDVLRLHAIAIADQGGDPAILNRGLLESAVAMPQQQFGGEYLHHGVPAMAAAYAFHICKNHAFADGNKRAAAAACIAFLSDNGWAYDADVDEGERAFLALAAGETDKQGFTDWLSTHCHEKPRMDLREFFAGLTLSVLLEKYDQVSGGGPNEFMTSVDEAVGGIPLIRELAHRGTMRRVSGEQWNGPEIHQVGLLLALYRIAEDMGYEW